MLSVTPGNLIVVCRELCIPITELHWLDVPERIKYKLGMLMHRRQHNKAPRYLMDQCTSVGLSDVAYRQRLRSASSHEVSVPRHRLSTHGRRAFAVAGPTVWNSLPEGMRDPEVSEACLLAVVRR